MNQQQRSTTSIQKPFSCNYNKSIKTKCCIKISLHTNNPQQQSTTTTTRKILQYTTEFQNTNYFANLN